MTLRLPSLLFLCFCLTDAAGALPPTAEQMRELLKSRPEIDEIRWKDPARGAAFTVRIIEASPTGITVEKQLPSGLTTRRLSFSEIGSIHFGSTPAEAELHENPGIEASDALRILWDARKATISLDGSNIGATGLAFAKSLRATGTSTAFEEAAEVLSFIISKDTEGRLADPARAEQETLTFLRTRVQGDPEAIDQAAWKITEDSAAKANTDAMLLATAWLADRHFSQLKALEAENPRWIEDNEIRPQRDRLYHLALDFALYPSLFEDGDSPEVAAGLAKAANVYQFTGERAELKDVLEDLAALHPASPEALESAPLLAALRQSTPEIPLAAPPAEKNENEEESSPPVGAPPAARQYNLFDD